MKMIPTSFMALLLIASGAIINTAAAQSDSELKFEEIVVTASKRGETNLQDMPMAITALTELKMEMIGADDMMDYLGLAPGISYRLTSATGSRDDIRGGRRLNIRGIESGPDGIPTTAFYLDDTPVPVMDPKLFDIARVEILRGPQGTLYGANSMGGTVRMVTNKPEINRFAYKVDNTVGFTPEGGEILHLNGMLNVPILEDKLALRGVLFTRSEGGFIDIVEDPDMYTDAVGHTRSNLDQNDEKAHGGRIGLKWTPTDNLTITPSVFYQSIEIDGTPEYEPQIGDLLHRDCHGCGEITPPRQPTEEHRVAERQTNDFYLYSMEIAYDFGNNMSLTSSTSTFNSKMWSVDDFSKGMVRWGLPSDPQAIGLQDIRTDRFTQEIRLSSTGDKLSWIAGFFYMDEHRDFFQDLPNTGHLWCTVDLCGADLSLSDSLFTGVETHDDKSTAVFGEVTYAPSEEWEITAGLRYFSDDQNQLIIFDGFFNGGYAKVEGVAAGESFSPKLQAAYHPSEDTMFYALAAKGFRPGGPTNLIPTTCDADLLLLGLSEPKSEYDSDTLWNYETGVKTSLMNNRVTLNATAFYMDWTDVQNGVRLACGFGFVGNVGAAESTGVELEFSAYLTDNFNFSGSMGYTDATYTETSEETGVMAGDRIVNTPRMTASLVGQYLFPVVDEYQGYLSGSYQYTDDIFDPSNSLGTPKRDAFSTVDIRLGVQHENWEVVVFVDNLTDVRGMLFHSINQAAGVSPFIANTVGVIRPRTYGVTLRWNGGDD